MIVGSLGGCSSHRSTSLAMLTHWSPIRSTHRMMMGSCQDTRETGDSASASAWWALCGAIGRSRGADGQAEDRVEPSIGCPSTSKFPRRRPQSSSNTAVAGFARILAVRRMAQSGSVVVSPRDLITPEQIDRTPRRRPGASPGRGHAAGPAPPLLQVLADRFRGGRLARLAGHFALRCRPRDLWRVCCLAEGGLWRAGRARRAEKFLRSD